MSTPGINQRLASAAYHGQSLSLTIERCADNLLFDFGTNTFVASPTAGTQALAEGTGLLVNTWPIQFHAETYPLQYPDGNYNLVAANASGPVACLQITLTKQSDIPPTSGGATSAAIAAAVWQDLLNGSDFAVNGSIGKLLAGYTTPPTTASIATAVWQDPTTGSDFTAVNSVGKLLTTNLDTNVGSRLATSSYAAPPTTAAITTAILTDTTASNQATANSLGYNIQHAPPWYSAGAGSYTPAQIASAVWSDTTTADLNVTGSPGNAIMTNLDAKVSSRLAASGYTAPPTTAQIATAVLTDTTASDLAAAGSLGHIVTTAPSWYTGGGGGGGSGPTAAQIATAVWTDTTASDFTAPGSPGAAIGLIDAKVSSRLAASAYTAPPVGSDGNVLISLTQAIPAHNTAQTVGDALNAARAQGFGAWSLSGTLLTLYAADGSTVVRQFTLNSPFNPTSRT
jgi:hypothetical protein